MSEGSVRVAPSGSPPATGAFGANTGARQIARKAAQRAFAPALDTASHVSRATMARTVRCDAPQVAGPASCATTWCP
eukprot:1958013-Amphidinium_carterae.1